MRLTATCAVLLLAAAPALAQDMPKIAPDVLEKAVAGSWQGVKPELKPRIEQDETLRLCSAARNDVPKDVADRLVAAARATIVYPADGKLSGDWKKGEAGALNGYGFRMGDDPKRPAGGNCYACHEISPKEVSAGTLGPSLKGYGKLKGSTPAVQKEVYDRIFNAQSALACSNMPRFGHNKVLAPEDIAHYVAFLLDPGSPVNQE